MASVPFHYIDLRAFCYATEDDQRVETALGSLLPDGADVERTKSEGHLGDRILILSSRVENADGMRHVLDKLRELDDIEQVRSELDQRVDDNCSFFISLDKQSAYRDEIELGPGITLRAKVEAYPAKKDTAVENAREALS